MAELQAIAESLWNDRRKELYRLLAELNEGLSELYKRAIDELESLPSEEMSAVTCSTVSYYARELLNNLPDFLTTDGATPPRGQYQGLQSKLLKRFAGLVTATNLCRASIDDQKVVVSGELAAAAYDLAQAYEKGSISRRQRDSVIILGRVQDDAAANHLLKEARDVLTGHQHVNLGQATNVNTKSTFVESFRIIEDLLLARLGSFFVTVRELRTLMNKVEEADSDDEPDVAEIVKEVLLRLGDYQHRRGFYEGIRSPKWMRHLKDMGAFNVGTQDAGSIDAYLRWPEGSYLVAMARVCADDVLDVCLDAGKSHNPYVQAQALSAAARLPGEKAMRLHGVSRAWSESMRTMPYCFEPHDAAQLAANMFQSATSKKQIKKAESVLSAFFLPCFRKDDVDVYYPRTKVVAAIPEYCYRKELGFVVEHSGGKCGCGQIRVMLERYERRYCESRHLEYGASDVYMSWRPSIALPGDQYPSNYGNHLVDAFVRVLVGATERMPGCLLEAYQSKSTLVSRSALFVIAEHVGKLVAIARENAEFLSSKDESIRNMAQGILDDPELLYKGMEAEAVALVRVCMSSSRLFDMQVVVSAIRDYRQRREAEHAASPWLQDLTEDERNDVASRHAIADEHLLLARIGRRVLPKCLAERLAALDADLGVISSEDLTFASSFAMASWGFESPLTTAEMLKMSPDELSGFLCRWQPKSVHDEPSVTGLANTLQQAVSQDAMHFTGLLESIESLNPRYTGAMLRGLSDAIDCGSKVPVDDLAAICSWVCSRVGAGLVDVRDSSVPIAEGYDARYDAGDLAEKLIQSGTVLSAESWERLIETGVSLSRVREQPKEDELVYSYPEDPITVLINLLLPKGIEILALTAGLSPIVDVRRVAMDALVSVMTSHQDVLVFGALGMVFPSLATYNSQFAQKLASMILLTNEKDLFIAFVYPSLYSYRYHHETLCALETILRRVIILSRASDSAVRDVLTSKTMERIGFWLYADREAGHMMSGDPLYLLWREGASIKERRNVLCDVCRRASYEGVPSAVLNHAMGYWDEVREYELQSGVTGELTGVFLLAHNPAVDAQWLAPRMVIEASQNDISDKLIGVSERLVDVARVKPSDAMAVLEHAASAKSGAEQISWIGKPLVQTLAYIFVSRDKALVNRAKALMDKLGRQGMINLDNRVHEAVTRLNSLDLAAVDTTRRMTTRVSEQ